MKNRLFRNVFLAILLVSASPFSSGFAQRMPVPGFAGRRLQRPLPSAPPYARLRQLQSLPNIQKPLTGTARVLVVLIDFPDYTWDTQADSNFQNPANQAGSGDLYQPSYYRRMLFSLDTFADPLSRSSYTGSLRDYYRENSYGQFDVIGEVAGWFRAAHNYSYYCNTDGLPNTADDFGLGSGEHSAATLVKEALAAADSMLDLSLFDGNGDGIVDALFVVHAGPGAEQIYSEHFGQHYNYFWSHQSSLYYRSPDGVQVNRYTLQPEDGTVGVFCHEFGHVLGLPDLYDTDSSSEGIGEWGLMSSGAWCAAAGDRLGTRPTHLCAWSKWKLGWLSPAPVRSDQQDLRLPPVEQTPRALMVWSAEKPSGSPPSEFFLLENRQPILFDTGLTRRQLALDKPQPRGLIIYHVNEKQPDNDDEHHKRVDVEEASPVWYSGEWFENLDHPRDLARYRYLYIGNRGDNGDPFPGYRSLNADSTDFVGPRSKTEFSDTTHPASTWDSGEPSGIRIYNIHLEGPDVLLNISFNPTTAVSAKPVRESGPQRAVLSVYPNPGKGPFVFSFAGPWRTGPRSLVVCNLLGQVVWSRKNVRGRVVQWQPKSLPSGLYWVIARSNKIRTVTKLLLLP